MSDYGWSSSAFLVKKHSSQVRGFTDDSASDNGLLKCILTVPA